MAFEEFSDCFVWSCTQTPRPSRTLVAQMNDALAEDFMAPVRTREARLADLNRQIAEKEKELAALESQCVVTRKAMNELGEAHVELQIAVNAQRVLLSKSQAELAKATADFDELKKRVASL